MDTKNKLEFIQQAENNRMSIIRCNDNIEALKSRIEELNIEFNEIKEKAAEEGFEPETFQSAIDQRVEALKLLGLSGSIISTDTSLETLSEEPAKRRKRRSSEEVAEEKALKEKKRIEKLISKGIIPMPTPSGDNQEQNISPDLIQKTDQEGYETGFKDLVQSITSNNPHTEPTLYKTWAEGYSRGQTDAKLAGYQDINSPDDKSYSHSNNEQESGSTDYSSDPFDNSDVKITDDHGLNKNDNDDSELFNRAYPDEFSETSAQADDSRNIIVDDNPSTEQNAIDFSLSEEYTL